MKNSMLDLLSEQAALTNPRTGQLWQNICTQCDLGISTLATLALAGNDPMLVLDDAPPNVPMHRTIIYETHLKGFTMQCGDIDQKLRGTYAGMAAEPVVAYLQGLGKNAPKGG